jgi:inorganic phosphate transporter, PiT family
MPDTSFAILVFIVILAIGFGIVNGFNDAANAIATAIGTRALSPRNAIAMAAVLNFAGAATGLAVAHTIGKGILVPEAITFATIIAALVAIIIWGTAATFMGLPISLHHGFIAGLAAAGMAVSGGGAVVWSVMARIAAAVFIAPALGFMGGFLLMNILYWIFYRTPPAAVRSLFANLQILSAGFMAYSHGKNDGQMPIGVITMALVIYYRDATLWDRLSLFNGDTWWIIVISAIAISSGTAMGGRRVIRTLGLKVTTLRNVHGFAAESSAASVIEVASHFGIPVSTTHCISAAIMGVGSTSRFSAVRWGLAGDIVAAWILTFPICGSLGYLISWLLGVAF